MTETLPEHCEGCGAPVSRWLPTEPPNHGMAFGLRGSYAGFTDSFEPQAFQHRLDLCHDCVLRMVELFPIMRFKLGVACHPCETEVPCCAYGFTTSDEKGFIRIPNNDLSGWRSVPMDSLNSQLP
jgi:hypothetical protein